MGTSACKTTRVYLESRWGEKVMLLVAFTELAKKVCPVGCVISPLRQQVESRNLGQIFLANSVHNPTCLPISADLHMRGTRLFLPFLYPY